MNIDLSKVTAEPVTIFAAIRTSESDPVNLPITADLDLGVEDVWKRFGRHQKKSTKFAPAPMTADVDGLEATHGFANTITGKVVELRNDIIATFESLVNQQLDIILRVIGKDKFYRLQKLSLKFSPNDAFNFEETRGIDVTLMAGSQKLSDIFDQGELQNYFNLFNPENL